MNVLSKRVPFQFRRAPEVPAFFNWLPKFDLAFLKPLSWIESTRAEVGKSIPMQLHEMGLDGPAEVVAA